MLNSEWLMVKVPTLSRFGLPKIAAISGLRIPSRNALITRANAAPMTTATARSTTFPRMMNSLKPLSIVSPRSCVCPVPARR